ncbi:Glyoxylase, beta-lactamase superfamily II [Halogranum amylolyticum]|uniref:Glyoxylase, beta-lactamase superfamily II n=1 Tax=Halogranum amylolyticum TaxID=660520 RepID=A0A1H8P2D1_9EURY|nr:MBL fold metallo-hydrolase [Halogranum amylolyticum]SEO35987.1 Glyoxylase, beta-lactamase superfamily II [Halogranum amylolyticum]
MGLPPNHVWRMRLRGVNAYLVDADVLTLVDAGTPWDADRIRTRIEDVGHDVADIDRVLLTHYDLDHVGTLGKLDLDADVYLAAPDADYFRRTQSPPLTNHKGLFQRLTGLLLSEPTFPVHTVDDGQRIGPFVAHHTPGHTPGHTAYVHDEYDVAFVGDLVRTIDGELHPSPWVLSYSLRDVKRSIRKLADNVPETEVLAVGHGNPVRANGGIALRQLADRL